MMNRNDAQPFTRAPSAPGLWETLITYVGTSIIIGAAIMALLVKGA